MALTRSERTAQYKNQLMQEMLSTLTAEEIIRIMFNNVEIQDGYDIDYFYELTRITIRSRLPAPNKLRTPSY